MVGGLGLEGLLTRDDISGLPLAEHTQAHPRLEAILQRPLTVTELSAAESMGSEHASYGASRFYLKTLLPTDGPNHLAAIGDEAAAAALYVNPETGESIVIAYSSESHNYPSYVCAHPGAATGTGGNQRDNIALTATHVEAVSEARRQCHPLANPHGDPVEQHVQETTRGIADYANAKGVPHQDGSIKLDPRFAGNNLVNVLAISVADKKRLQTNQVPVTDEMPSDQFIAIYVGKASDTTGLGGTKAASAAIDMSLTELNESAVQDPDPHLQEAEVRGIERLVDIAIAEGWADKLSIKDMGAAGLLCSTIEQLHDNIGVVINGDLVPQQGERSALELLEAETQERFFIYVHQDYAQRVLEIFNSDIGLPHINKGARAAVVGRCNDSGNYTFVRNGTIEVDVPVKDLTAGPIKYKPVKEPVRKRRRLPRTDLSLASKAERVLESINFKSDAPVHGHYDKHVRSTHVVVRGEGAATLRTHPSVKNRVGYSVSFDSNSVMGLLDPMHQAEDSFVRGAWRMATVGCSVIGVTNNANYGRTDVPEEMWEFARGQAGVGKACYNWQLGEAYLEMIAKDPEIAAKLAEDPRRHLTVNSGNCSLNKANANTGTAIPPTTILGLIGWTNRPEHHAKWDMEEDGVLYLIGRRERALGGTDYAQNVFGFDCLGGSLHSIEYARSQREVDTLIQAVRSGFVSAANIIEEGGLCNTVAEMVANTSREVYVEVNLDERMGRSDLTSTQKLFSEGYGMVVSVSSDRQEAFEALMRERNVDAYEIGLVEASAQGRGSLEFDSIEERVIFEQTHLQEVYRTKLERNVRGERVEVRAA